MSEERERVLKMVEAGHISAEEALQLIDALDEADSSALMDAQPATTPTADVPEMKGWWIYPAAIGAVVMAMGAPLVALGLSGRAAILWALCCGWIPLFIGLAIFTVGVWSRNSRWFHLRINNTRSGRRTFALSLPLPLAPTAWVLRIARPYVPQFGNTAIDEAILALRDASQAGDTQPIFIDVQDDNNGEHVLIYIG